ncbi:PEP/pyruvate-binding domain-containing protein [Bacillus sp. 03113]|uniref:PEP/pyruvate-binding domain-containing protein n=1 Tax=Bacillus sp. 03113 TaxID=2578211 RepID=UPI001143F40D|nr:PEP/pyruvate-binding domain-containing protein [Bacillus sp. 03113]
MRRIIPFSETQAEDAIGGKAENLALLFQSQFPVPKGFIITSYAFELEIQRSDNPDWWIYPNSLSKEIEEAYKAYVNPPVVVRSSCSAEDLETASFAGQFVTLLNITSVNLLESIKRCWLSVYQSHAQSYLAQRFSAVDQVPAMSIIVQELIDADVAGVIFSKNPITGNEDEIVINSSFGLGEAVVSGLVTPDFFILSKQGNAILKKELGDKEYKVVLYQDGTRILEMPPEEKSSFSLREEQLYELKKITMDIETIFGYPVDLEFAYRQGKLYILQARQITT